MDPVALAFYAVICAALGVASPLLRSWPVRLAVGAGVGVAGATVLPLIRPLLPI